MKNIYNINSFEELQVLREVLSNIAENLSKNDEDSEGDKTSTDAKCLEETKSKTSIIEQVINEFLYTCKEEGKLPTYEEVQVIKTLDDILYRYNLQ